MTQPATNAPAAAPADDDATLLHRVADLLYDVTDPRSTPWPDPATLGRLRSRLRGIADDIADVSE
jgi:hypothetical protein